MDDRVKLEEAAEEALRNVGAQSAISGGSTEASGGEPPGSRATYVLALLRLTALKKERREAVARARSEVQAEQRELVRRLVDSDGDAVVVPPVLLDADDFLQSIIPPSSRPRKDDQGDGMTLRLTRQRIIPRDVTIEDVIAALEPLEESSKKRRRLGEGDA